MERLILFLIRLKLGVKTWEPFRFTNQKSDDVYYFGERYLWKRKPWEFYGYVLQSGVSLNWLLDPACKIEKVEVRK